MLVNRVYLAGFALLTACARPAIDPADLTSTMAMAMTTAPRRADYLTDDEITSTNADASTAYDALARLRPNWFAAHGVTSFSANGKAFAMVYLDGQKYGDLNMLRNVEAFQVANARYYDVTQAGARFGIAAGSGGVIEIKTK
ncbi:MAG: hypothetical protein ABI408_02845 [Gemmatimonadaceae bacterium]